MSRYNLLYVVQLQEKYPFIYEILRTAPPDDQIARINKNRLLSTYQVDYCKMRKIIYKKPYSFIYT